jgi:hypothetical protein
MNGSNGLDRDENHIRSFRAKSRNTGAALAASRLRSKRTAGVWFHRNHDKLYATLRMDLPDPSSQVHDFFLGPSGEG